MSVSILSNWKNGKIPINRQATHCPECGYRTRGDKDAGIPVVCDECMPDSPPIMWSDEDFSDE